MADCTIKNPKEFSLQVPKWDKSTLADGDAMGAVIEKLLNNDAFLDEMAKRVVEVTLPASGWSGSFPFTQTVAVSGFSDEDEPVLTMIISNTAPEANVKAYKKAFGFIFAGTVNSTGATFYASKKPETDITVGLKGR